MQESINYFVYNKLKGYILPQLPKHLPKISFRS